MKRKHVLTGLATVAAITLVSTALAGSGDSGPLGGSSAKKKRGPRGLPGPAGPQGPQGQTGAIGPSSARESIMLTNVQFGLTNDPFATSQPFAAISDLAPGAYAITAKLVLADTGMDAGTVNCQIFTGDAAEDSASQVKVAIGSGAGQSALTTQTMTMTRTFSSTGSVDIRCRELSAAVDAGISDINLVAIMLGSESSQSP